MVEKKLNFLLMGKTGQGKSATGNTILNRKAFKTSSNVNSETKEVNCNFSEFENYTLLMVDGPGLEDTDMDKVTDRTTTTKHMDKALAMCYGGVDAFLLVTKFGNRFTQEDKDTLDALKTIFGDEFINHLIIIVTCGDNFEGAMEEQGTPEKSFHQWCSEQNDDVFLQLYDDCERRVVLFNNREKDEYRNHSQIQEVVQHAEYLQGHRHRYTNQCFETAKYERNKLILTLRAPQLEEEFQKKMALLVAAIEDLVARPSEDVKEKIRERVNDLRNEINRQDQGYGVLENILKTLKKVEENLDDAAKLIALGKELEETREAKTTWGVLGTICATVGGVIAVLNPVGVVVGAGVAACAAVGAVGAAIGYLMSNSDEQEIVQKQEEIKKKVGPKK